jgi:thiamine pyrophosphokinase
MEKSDHICLFLNGTAPDLTLLQRYCSKDALRIATDGAYDYCINLGYKPDILIGDMDSVSELPGDGKTGIVYNTDINNNDLEKALMYCREQGFRKLRIFGLDGKRIDHFLINIATLTHFSGEMDIEVYSNEEYLHFLVPGKYRFSVMPGQRFSLLALKTVSGLQLKGVTYETVNAVLEPGSRGLGNVCRNSSLHMAFSSGLLIFMSELPA